MMLAGFGFLLQNFQLHFATYYYVHTMTQHDLLLNHANTTQFNDSNFIALSIGRTPQNVSFGALQDTPTLAVGPYQHTGLLPLDMLAAAFPLLFIVLAVAMDNVHVWTRIMLCFFVLAVGKGFFAWITVEPDSNGWQACRDRLAGSTYSAEWYSQRRSFLDFFTIDPTSRLCADMMWSGHTYFVALFAFGLHECTRLALRASSAWKRILAESIVAFLAVVQQVVEIYFVLKSRFHYSADVVMAILVTYLLYTNSTIAIMTSRWLTPDPKRLKEDFLTARREYGRKYRSPTWMLTLLSRGVINLGCCCCDSSQQYIYSREDVMKIVHAIELATSSIDHSERFPHDHSSHLKMTPDIIADITEEMHMLHDRSIWHIDEDDGAEHSSPASVREFQPMRS